VSRKKSKRSQKTGKQVQKVKAAEKPTPAPSSEAKLKETAQQPTLPLNPPRISLDYIAYALLLIIFFISYYIRAVMPHDSVFQRGVVGFAADDAVFHMRLVENTIANFPHRLVYDAFTRYPFGEHLHWGPLFDQSIAFLAFLAGGGNPSPDTINTIGAYFPAVMGALIVFPVYFISREIFDRKAAVISAMLAAVLPGQYLSRTILGFTDNHVAEIFFTTLMMAFLILALNRSEHVTLEMVQRRDWSNLKTPLTYSVLTGIAFGAYLLTWTAGVLFGVIVGIFFVIQAVINQLRGDNIEYLSIVGATSYAVAFVMVLPVFDPANGFESGHYSYLHLAITGAGAVLLLCLSLLHRVLSQKNLDRYYPLLIGGGIVAGLILMKLLLPDMYNASVGQFNFIFKGRSGGGLTIAEASPLTSQMKWSNFTTLYYIAYPAMFFTGYKLFKELKPKYTLLLVWSIIILLITLAQNRFAYYYAVNVAVLSGGFGSFLLNITQWDKLTKAYESSNPKDAIGNLRIWHIIAVLVIIAVFIYPPADVTLVKGAARWGPVSPGYYEWHEALTWMRENTPDPGLDYYGVYEMPPRGEPYPYPETAYGVMSWWDYGHIITYWAHRIPNANPFQSGIGGGKNHEPGASTFLTAQSEEEANKVLDALGINGKPGARYVVSNAYMAYAILTVFAEWNESNTGYYTQVNAMQNGELVPVTIPTRKYFNTMESKLHIFDGNGLKHYRLVHESAPNPFTLGGNTELQNKYVYNQVYGGNLKLENSGYAKIFEYVKGATITGRAPEGATVTITNTIKTNTGRSFTYTQSTEAVNGSYTLTVPYSTEGPLREEGYTNFDTAPTGKYTLTAGNKTVEVSVSEEAVMKGETLKVDLV
jgi:dolichyl-diphosphooligosaccharide--protein glycosyltransferase